MSTIALQLSPEARSAYFADYREVARRELEWCLGERPLELRQVGPLEFFILEAGEGELGHMLRLSFVQGAYAVEGERLLPLDVAPEFRLHEDFVFGSKFRGKTNERLTQMLINVGLAAIGRQGGEGVKLLDPMCGRATTLLWAMRYGMTARGIEPDGKALADIHRHLKKWTKLHRQKHKLGEGHIHGGKKKGAGMFLDFSADESSMRVVIGDARETGTIYKKERFDLLVSDLPYGVQHFSSEGTRNPLAVIADSVTAWRDRLKVNGVAVLAFNRNNPKREALLAEFENAGFEVLAFQVPHRMSESIVRDVIVLKKQ